MPTGRDRGGERGKLLNYEDYSGGSVWESEIFVTLPGRMYDPQFSTEEISCLRFADHASEAEVQPEGWGKKANKQVAAIINESAAVSHNASLYKRVNRFFLLLK